MLRWHVKVTPLDYSTHLENGIWVSLSIFACLFCFGSSENGVVWQWWGSLYTDHVRWWLYDSCWCFFLLTQLCSWYEWAKTKAKLSSSQTSPPDNLYKKTSVHRAEVKPQHLGSVQNKVQNLTDIFNYANDMEHNPIQQAELSCEGGGHGWVTWIKEKPCYNAEYVLQMFHGRRHFWRANKWMVIQLCYRLFLRNMDERITQWQSAFSEPHEDRVHQVTSSLYRWQWFLMVYLISLCWC